MDPQQRLEQVTARLTASGYEVTPNAQIGGATTVRGHTSTFRWRWLATRVHLLVYVQTVDTVTTDGLERFAVAAMEDALARKGGMRGMQVGVAVVPLQIGARVDDGARRFAEHQILRRYAAFTWPVAMDAPTGQASRHLGRPAIGGLYTSWMRQQIDTVTAGG